MEVPSQGDRFAPYAPVDPDAPALVAGGVELTGAQLVARAREDASELGLAPGSRLLTGRTFDSWDGLSAGLFAPWPPVAPWCSAAIWGSWARTGSPSAWRASGSPTPRYDKRADGHSSGPYRAEPPSLRINSGTSSAVQTIQVLKYNPA